MLRGITYPIAEVFRSIQGEGFHAGRPAVFVRFSGCNLKCSFCDTVHTPKQFLLAEQITGKVKELIHNGDLIVLTGGEPFLHDLSDVLLCFNTFKPEINPIAIETNGTLFQTGLEDVEDRYDWLTVSPKAGYLIQASTAIKEASEIKVVFGDYDPELIRGWIDSSLFEKRRCFIQPMSEDFQPALEYVLAHPEWNLSIQLQKVLKIL